MVQFLSVLVVSACSILLISANRHTSPYPVYPLGISYLKTYLERTISGIRVDTADCNLLTDEELAERIRTLAPRYIGVSLRNVDGANSLDRRGFLPEYKALIDVIRAASDAPLIIGGAGFSIYPQAFMRELGADYGIHGEGEGPLAELIGALERGETGADIPAVYTRDGRTGRRHRPGRRPAGAGLLHRPGLRLGRGPQRSRRDGQGVGFPRRPAERAGRYAAAETK